MKHLLAWPPLFVLLAAAVPPPTEEITEVPFAAYLAHHASLVYETPDDEARLVGRLRWGDVVTVTECVPACDAEDAWAHVEPYGYVPLAALRPGAPDALAADRGALASFRYVRVGPRGATTRAEPRSDSPGLDRHREDDHLALVADPSRDVPGWGARPGGGYISLAEVRPYVPSTFEGVHDPDGPFVFVTRATQLTADDGTTRPVARYEHFRYERNEPRGRVRVEGGTLPRAYVRYVAPRPRPADVPPDTKWVHVDLERQVLTAYEGDRWVLATLVSTGAATHPTETGHYRVTVKVIHDDMHGPHGDPWIVEEVPYVMYFHRDQALHGAYWHDAFGVKLSHGCVNLPPAVAAWMFTWAPPELPTGWHSVFPARAGVASLRVIVDRR